VHLLQIVREAVLNAIKHAQASEITVSCVTAWTVRTASAFAITASGLARQANRRDIRLNIMRERAQRRRLLHSQPQNGGTLVT
jgi:two-component system nitrate/nitrite sensor histidine kinase NarQ